MSTCKCVSYIQSLIPSPSAQLMRGPKNFITYSLFPAAAGGSVSPKEGSPWRLSPRKSLTQLILLMNSLCIIFSLKGMGTCDSGPGQRDQRSADCYAQCREVTMLAPVAVTTRVAAQAGYFRHTLYRILPCIAVPQSIIGALLIPHNHWTIVIMIYRLIGTDSMWHSRLSDRGVLARRGPVAKWLDTSAPLCSPNRHFILDKPPGSRWNPINTLTKELSCQYQPLPARWMVTYFNELYEAWGPRDSTVPASSRGPLACLWQLTVTITGFNACI